MATWVDFCQIRCYFLKERMLQTCQRQSNILVYFDRHLERSYVSFGASASFTIVHFKHCSPCPLTRAQGTYKTRQHVGKHGTI